MILFLYGTDTLRSKRKLDEIVVKFKGEHDPGGMNIAVLEARGAAIGDIQQALYAPPFLATRRMVILKGALEQKKDEQEPLINLLEQLPSSTVAVLYETADETACKKSPLWKKLTTGKFHWEFAPLVGAQLSAWLQKEAQQNSISLTPGAVAALIGTVGSDLARASNEIAKLAAYVGTPPSLNGERAGGEGKKLVTPEDVAQLVTGEATNNIFGFLDAVAAKQPSQAARLLENQIAAGTEPMQLLAMMARTVRLLLQSKDMLLRGMNEPEAANQLGIHPFAAKKAVAQSRKFEMNALLNLHTRLLDADRKIKTGLSPTPRVMLDLLVAKAVA